MTTATQSKLTYESIMRESAIRTGRSVISFDMQRAYDYMEDGDLLTAGEHLGRAQERAAILKDHRTIQQVARITSILRLWAWSRKF